MALKIVTAQEPMRVETLITFIYGDPGIGKTSLAFS
ncbi:AAA family ATPase, partial [Acinetobacter baumannii]|nr:AAA family ATPase [Acinetobacter baumannii]